MTEPTVKIEPAVEEAIGNVHMIAHGMASAQVFSPREASQLIRERHLHEHGCENVRGVWIALLKLFDDRAQKHESFEARKAQSCPPKIETSS